MALFNNILSSGESLFKNEYALDFDYVPKMMPYREQQQRYAASAIMPMLSERQGKNLFIYGPPGIGKTAAIRWVLRDLEETTDNVEQIYINCWQKNTSFKILLEICDQLGYKFTHNKKTDELFKVVKQMLDKKAAVFAFDEIDKVEDFDFLYMILEEVFRRSVLLITNYKEWMIELDERVKSRLVPDKLEFQQYNEKETEGILRIRIEYAFVPGCWEESAIKMIAKKTSEIKDIRSGLYLLRQAGMIAEDRSQRKITAEHAAIALGKLDEFTVKSKENLEDETKIILDILKESDSIKIGDLHKKYLEKGGTASYKSFRRKINHLEENKFISIERVTDATGNTSIIRPLNVKRLTEF